MKDEPRATIGSASFWALTPVKLEAARGVMRMPDAPAVSTQHDINEQTQQKTFCFTSHPFLGGSADWSIEAGNLND